MDANGFLWLVRAWRKLVLVSELAGRVYSESHGGELISIHPSVHNVGQITLAQL